MNQNLIIEINECIFIEDFEKAFDLLQKLQNQQEKGEKGVKIPIARFIVSSYTQIYTSYGDYYLLKAKILEFLTDSYLISDKNTLISQKVAEIEKKELPFILKILESYFNCLFILNLTEEVQSFYIEIQKICHLLPGLFSLICSTYKNIKEIKIGPENVKPISDLIEFFEDNKMIEITLKLQNQKLASVEIDPKNKKSLILFDSNQTELKRLILFKEVNELTDFDAQNNYFKFKAIKTHEGIWKGVLSENPDQFIIHNLSIYQKPDNAYLKGKNWDKIVDEEEKKNLQEKDYDGVDPAMHFFREIYKNADEETRRAMMKSYTESDGKSLSTNWKDVQNKNFKEEKK